MLFDSTRLRRMRAAAHRPFLVLLTMVTALGLTACPGEDDPTDEDDNEDGAVTGTWVLEDSQGTVFMRITSSTVAIYYDSGAGTCFLRDDYDIADVDGDVYTIAPADDPSAEFEVELTRSGDNLVYSDDFGTATFEPSSQNLGNLEICEEPGGNLPTCSTLPAVTLGGSVDGALAGTDPANPDGSRYDLYRLQIGSTTNVGIDMNSDNVDAYLVLFSGAGDYLDENDDRDDTTLDSRIDRSLTAGCYIIMATSYGADEFGGYTVSASTN